MRHAARVLAAAFTLAGCTNFATPTGSSMNGDVDGVTLRQPVATYNIEHHGPPTGDWVNIVIADVSTGVPADKGVCGKNFDVESQGPENIKTAVINDKGVRVPSMTIIVDEESVSHRRNVPDEAFVVFDSVKGPPKIGSEAPTGSFTYATGGFITLIKSDDETGGKATGSYELTFRDGSKIKGDFVADRCEALPALACGCSSATSGLALLLSALAIPAMGRRRRRSA